MRSIYKLSMLFGLVCLMAACQANPFAANPNLAAGKLEIKAGATSITGRLVYATTGQPYVTEPVSLAEVHYNEAGEGAFALNSRTSPHTSTDENGFFVFKDIPVRDYVMVTGDPMTRYLILNDLSTGKVKIWSPKADKILDAGELRFEYNN